MGWVVLKMDILTDRKFRLYPRSSGLYPYTLGNFPFLVYINNDHHSYELFSIGYLVDIPFVFTGFYAFHEYLTIATRVTFLFASFECGLPEVNSPQVLIAPEPLSQKT